MLNAKDSFHLIALAITDEEKAELVQDMEVIQKFAEKKCLSPDEKLNYYVQVLAGWSVFLKDGHCE